MRRIQVIWLNLKCAIEVCEARDVKGLYAKAGKGDITNFTGMTSPYKEPNNPNLAIDTGLTGISDTHALLVKFLNNYELSF
ncbi:adenylyl-sulfate kinase [Parapedobacter indicus]|uniref:Adenylylsulfate kinase n=1 Tax=Parapedobacter indicus TaxID=1477437 RepID=A0A1I3HSY8_9SPHI|nr:adenylyl-sulfate kinase [Parapedobacter indicus]PPL03152.1 adenylylsulfate kinase [Parapedobacter indicus]SFI38719.1 adenylylsulfate kinase [Parapedobacter indicus]